MNTKGLRISDSKEGKCIPLSDILETISNANQFSWALLWFDATPIENEGKFFTETWERAKKSKNGLPYTFESLIELAGKIFQEIEVLIIGCKNKENIRRYNKDEEMYEVCDFVIEMIDGGFWEVFSKDTRWIDELSRKYKDVEFLPLDFQARTSRN